MSEVRSWLAENSLFEIEYDQMLGKTLVRSQHMLMTTSWYGNAFRITGLLWGESIFLWNYIDNPQEIPTLHVINMEKV